MTSKTGYVGSLSPEYALLGFLAQQPDLGTKWTPKFVRITADMPLTGTNKVMKGPLQVDGWHTGDAVWWLPTRDAAAYEPLADQDRRRLDEELAAHRRDRR